MVSVRHAASAILGFAWRAAVPLVGVAILLGMASGRASVPPGDVPESGPGGLLAWDEDGTLRLTMVAPEGGDLARCVLADRDGTELISITYRETGTLFFHLAESPTVLASGYRCANGDFGFGVGGEGLQFEYAGRPGRPPVVRFDRLDPRRVAWYPIEPEDGRIHDPGAPAPN